MNQQQFVDALKEHAAEAAVEGTLAQWESPSGRFPSDERRAQSAWFNALAEEDKQRIQTLVTETALATLFGVLCILDGARPIEPAGPGHLQLSRIEDGRATALTSSGLDSGLLHELL